MYQKLPRCIWTDNHSVGVALKEQVLPPGDNIPVQYNDWSLDALLMGDGSEICREEKIKGSTLEKIEQIDPGP